MGVAGWAAVAMDNARLYAAEYYARSEAEASSVQLADQAVELELTNQHLQDQAPELELQAETLRETAAALDERTAAAEAANRAKSDFLSTMSHELRTPLNAIGGYAELMAMGIRGPVTPQQAEDLRRVQASQRHLLRLVNDVLNYARIETGTVHYDATDVGLAEAVATVEPLVAPQLAAKGLAFSHEECGEPPPVARADGEKVRRCSSTCCRTR